MSFYQLFGTPGYLSGTAGTATIPAGASVLQIVTTGAGGATLSIFGATAIPLPAAAPYHFRYPHMLVQSKNNVTTAGSQDLIFTSTTSYYVEYVKAGNT